MVDAISGKQPKKIEDEIAASLGELTLEDLNKIRDQVKGKK